LKYQPKKHLSLNRNKSLCPSHQSKTHGLYEALVGNNILLHIAQHSPHPPSYPHPYDIYWAARGSVFSCFCKIVLVTPFYIAAHLYSVAFSSTCRGFIHALSDVGICSIWQIYLIYVLIMMVLVILGLWTVSRTKKEAMRHFQEVGTDTV
jgi:hypothetical protein